MCFFINGIRIKFLSSLHLWFIQNIKHEAILVQSQQNKMYLHHTVVELQLEWEDWQTWIHDRVKSFHQEPGIPSRVCAYVLAFNGFEVKADLFIIRCSKMSNIPFSDKQRIIVYFQCLSLLSDQRSEKNWVFHCRKKMITDLAFFTDFFQSFYGMFYEKWMMYKSTYFCRFFYIQW